MNHPEAGPPGDPAAVTEQPWLRKKKWRTGVIKGESMKAFWVILGFAAVWNAVSISMVVQAWDQVFDPSNRIALLALVFPLVGLFLCMWVVVISLRLLKFGRSQFVMESMPGVIGGRLAGTIRVNRRIEPGHGVRLRLSCIESKTTGRGKSSDTHKHVLHQEERVVAREQLSGNGSRTEIPVLFGIPYGVRPSGSPDSRTHVFWHLEVTAELPRLDYRTTFEVPVFRTEESSPTFQLDNPAMSPGGRENEIDVLLREQGLRRESRVGGVVFECPMLRSPFQGIVLLAAGSGFMAVPYFMVPEREWVLSVVFGLLGVFIFWWGLDHLFWCSRIEFRKGLVRLRHGLLGCRRTDIPEADVARVSVRKSSQSGHTAYYSVRFHLNASKGGRKITVAKRITGQNVAQGLADRFREALKS